MHTHLVGLAAIMLLVLLALAAPVCLADAPVARAAQLLSSQSMVSPLLSGRHSVNVKRDQASNRELDACSASEISPTLLSPFSGPGHFPSARLIYFRICTPEVPHHHDAGDPFPETKKLRPQGFCYELYAVSFFTVFSS
jgi:hypothetical protein